MRLALLQWSVRPCASPDAFWAHLDELLAQAAGAEIIVLPENFTFEMFGFLSERREDAMAAALAEHAPEIRAGISFRSQKLGATIVGGSTPLRREAGITNTCQIAQPDGRVLECDKQVLTPYEIDPFGLIPGQRWQQPASREFGVTVCYDSEFPESATALSGVPLVIVPAFTEGPAGAHRIRNSARARATELQCFVATCSLVGSLGFEPVPAACGKSAVFAPCMDPFPADGILIESAIDVESVTMIDLDLEALATARTEGEVRPLRDRLGPRWSPDLA